METVYIVTHEPFSKSMYDRYALSSLLNCYNIVYYDLSEIFYEKSEFAFYAPGVTVISVPKKKYLSFLYSNIISHTILFCFLEFNYSTLSVFLILRLKKCFLIYFNAYFTPFPNNTSSWLQRFYYSLSISRLLLRFNKLSLALLRLLTGVALYNLEFMCCVRVTKSRKYILINHPDVDIINKIPNKINSKNYVVYIDEFFPDHPDFKYLANYINISDFNIHNFNRNLYDFLIRTSDNSNVDIVIAKHPRREGNLFHDSVFSEVKNMTHELIKNCSGVILSQSASIGIAVYCNKPIILIDSILYPKYLRLRIKFFSKELNIKPISFDSTPVFTNIDITNYDKYIKKYLVFSDSANDEIVLNELLNKSKQVI